VDHDRLRADLLRRLPVRGDAARPEPCRREGIMVTIKRMGLTVIGIGTAAVAAAAAVLFVTLSPRAVYAVERAVAAVHGLQRVHLKVVPAGRGVAEAWASYDETGELRKLRMNLPESTDGHKVVYWEDGKATVVFKDKGSAGVMGAPDMAEWVRESFKLFDPKLHVTLLAETDRDVEMEDVVSPDYGDCVRIRVGSQRFLVDRQADLIRVAEKLDSSGEVAEKVT
jgi:hypothetical protein